MSTGHTQDEVEGLERIARKLLGLPRLPDTSTGIVSSATLARIKAKEVAEGRESALRTWGHRGSIGYAMFLPEDVARFEAVSANFATAERWKENGGDYSFPDHAKLTRADTSKLTALERALFRKHTDQHK